MNLIPSDWKHLLRIETSKNIFFNFFITEIKVSIKKVISSVNLLVLNTTKLSNSFHEQTSLKNTIFEVQKFGVNVLLTGLPKTFMDVYFLSSQ